MSSLARLTTAFLEGEEGATTAEYGILIVVIAGIAIFVLSTLNGTLGQLFGIFGSKVNSLP
jgi:Flp pilus assembly pilin Flp